MATKMEPLNKLRITVEFVDGTSLKNSEKKDEVIELLIKSGIVDQFDGKYQLFWHYDKLVCLKTL
jgi:DNA polymerase III alpha subunit